MLSYYFWNIVSLENDFFWLCVMNVYDCVVIRKKMAYTIHTAIVPNYEPYSLEWAESEINKCHLIS